jgi:cell shape-determining protein MreC
MTKVLFILSAIAMAFAAFFAHQNGRAFADARLAKAAVHRKIKTELGNLTEAIDKVTTAINSVKTAQGEVDVEGEKLKQTNLKVAQIEGESKRTMEEYQAKTKKLEALKTELALLPPGVKVESLTEDMNTIRKENAELQTQAEQKGKEADVESKNVEDARKSLQEIVARVEARKKAFERNSLTARIVAVNSDWGFVVIDAGEKQGITPDTKFLVTRGTQTVGKLSILSVQGQKTVANVIADTLAPGLTPAPGDRVILENLYQ